MIKATPRGSIRKKKVAFFFIVIMLAMIFILPVQESHACACCANSGEWYERAGKVSDYEFAEISRLRFSPAAKTFLTGAGKGEIKGVASVADTYALSLTRQGRRWALRFKDERGRTGTLTFDIPATVVSFGADMHRGEESGGGGALLYKEMRFAGRVTVGTGIFKKGITANTKMRLILQGTGNSCMSAEDFKHWTLQVSGPKASYSFYGSLERLNSQAGK
jgi:hypothetical protein